MPRNRHHDDNRTADLLEMLLVFQLHDMGVPQDRIAKTLGRQKAWVNVLITAIPKGGKASGSQAPTKKTPTRPRSR